MPAQCDPCSKVRTRLKVCLLSRLTRNDAPLMQASKPELASVKGSDMSTWGVGHSHLETRRPLGSSCLMSSGLIIASIISYLPSPSYKPSVTRESTLYISLDMPPDLETKPTEPGRCNLQVTMLSSVPAVSPILKAPACTAHACQYLG